MDDGKAFKIVTLMIFFFSLLFYIFFVDSEDEWKCHYVGVSVHYIFTFHLVLTHSHDFNVVISS